MASINKVIVLGNAGRDAEMRYLPDGKAVANVSIATTTRRKNRDTGETSDSTEWHRVTFYERLAEIAGEYIKKGASVYIEGRLKYGTYVDKQTGVEKNTVDIIATELQLMGGNQRSGGQGDGYEGEQGSDQGGYQQRQQAPQRPQGAGQNRPQGGQGGNQGYQQRPQQGGNQQRPQGGNQGFQQRPQSAAPRQQPQREPVGAGYDDAPFGIDG